MPNETYEAVLSGNLSGQFVQTITHWNVDNAGSVDPYTMAADIAAGLAGASGWIDALMTVCPAGYTATSVRVRRISSGGGATAIILGPAFTDSAGDRTGAIQTYQANPCVIWITTTRPDRPGRLFIPGLSETDADAGTYASGFVTAVNSFITASIAVFNTPGSGDPYQLVIWRRSISTHDDVTAGRLSPKIGTQRRRALPV